MLIGIHLLRLLVARLSINAVASILWGDGAECAIAIMKEKFANIGGKKFVSVGGVKRNLSFHVRV
jgi:hypothetical protein